MNHERRSPRSKDPQNAPNPHGAADMPDQSRHAGKPDRAQPSSGGTPQTSKGVYDKAHGRGGPANASSGYVRHPEKANGKNRTEDLADPQGS